MESGSLSLDWKKLFVGSKYQSLDFFSPELRDGVATVKPPPEVIDEGIDDWNHALVGQFIGLAPSFGSTERIIEMIWGKSSQVLENEPWHVQKKPLILRNWVPGMQKLSFDLSFMPIWVQLCNVPLELYSQKGLSYIASALGNPLYMDSITASKERLEFAKVCVEIEAGGVIPDFIHVVLKDGSSRSKSGGKKDINTIESGSKEIMPVNATVSMGITEITNTSKEEASESNVDVAMKNTVNSLQNLSADMSTTEIQEKTVSSEHGKAHVDEGNGINPLQEVVHSRDFSSLRDSLKNKAKGRKKYVVGSSSKMEVVADGPRKARVASMGVAIFLNDIKTKKKDHIEKAKSMCFRNVRGINNPLKHLKVLRRLDSCSVDVFYLMESCIIRDNSGSFSSALSGDWNFVENYDFVDGGRLIVENDIGSSSWVIGVDFNIIAKAEKNSDFDVMRVHCTSNMKDFQECLEGLDLMDHPFLGPLFTWSNKQEGSYLARKLDRVLVNDQRLLDYPESFVEFKAQGVSDHCLGLLWTQKGVMTKYPLPFKFFNCWTGHEKFLATRLLDYPESFVEFKAQGVSDHCLGLLWTQKGVMTKYPLPFKFFNCWTGHEKFLATVRDFWQGQCGGSAMSYLFNKLRNLKPLLKEFNKEYFSDISGRFSNKSAELEKIQIFNLAHTDKRRIDDERRIHVELVDLEVAESEFYRQKAKVH
ncbi:uncharacterized protein LOC120172755 [Hibiscus syriacus]|uniref:uncharacterized protein LOC120172755 n=1 Tax=Hibiscus syriacus TaxID=106335 RepID=UPI0019248839|nr:uncharacterized protein LOC120172755 [Hibiscus syriacus]